METRKVLHQTADVQRPRGAQLCLAGGPQLGLFEAVP